MATGPIFIHLLSGSQRQKKYGNIAEEMIISINVEIIPLFILRLFLCTGKVPMPLQSNESVYNSESTSKEEITTCFIYIHTDIQFWSSD